MEFGVGCKEQEFDFSNELKALDSAIKLISEFDVTDFVDISFDEISRYEIQICQMESVLCSSSNLFTIEFGVEGDGYEQDKETACIFLITVPVGSYIFGVILVLKGSVEKIEGERYRLISKDVSVEQKIISEKDETIANEDLVSAIECIEQKYDDEFSVVTMFYKK